MRNLTVCLDDDELPEMWDALLWVVDNKYPNHKNAEFQFGEVPPTGTYSRWREPEYASCLVSGYDSKTYARLPNLFVKIEGADIAVEDDPDGSYQGYLVHVTERHAGVDSKSDVLTQHALMSSQKEGFEFVDLKRVQYPKLESYQGRKDGY